MDLTRFLKNCSLCMKMADKRNYTEVDSQIGEFDLRKIIFEVLFVKVRFRIFTFHAHLITFFLISLYPVASAKIARERLSMLTS